LTTTASSASLYRNTCFDYAGDRKNHMTANRNHIQLLKKTYFRNHGVTLLELVVAILILSIVSVGALSYQYFATQTSRKADAQITATRTARFILDNWKKDGGDTNFKPETLNMGFTKNVNGLYLITVNALPMTVELTWQDVGYDVAAAVTLRQIQVSVKWRSDYQVGNIRNTDPVYTMTTYVRKDES
jgi:prepilin-type N-terminal cleavage/methylation domain-containing protein